MKKLLLFTIPIFLWTISVAQEIPPINGPSNKNLNDDNNFLLVQEISKMWDYWESNWENRWNAIYTYDENDSLIERLEVWGDGSSSKGRRAYSYDDYNRLVEQIHQRWDTSEWVNIDKQIFYYDTNGNLDKERHYSWWMDGEWHNSDKFIHSYDASNNRVYTLKQNFWNGSSWENEEQHTFTFNDNNNLVESMKQDWNGSTWLNTSKVKYYYDVSNNIIEYLMQSWVDDAWVTYGRYLCTFDNDNNRIKILNQHWNGIDWDNNHLDTYSYDASNNKVKWLSQTWFEDNGAYYWLNQIKNTYYYLPSDYEQFVAKNTDLDKPINDFQTTEDDIIIEPVRDDKILIGVEVLIDSVLHTSDADLEFTISHNGISETIIYHAGGEGDNFIGTKLTDRGVDTIAYGTAPFYSIYKPENPLSAFLETDPDGTWTLSIYDGVAGNTGVLKGWGLVLIYSSSSGIGDENKMALFEVYPNPVSNSVTIQSPVFKQQSAVAEIYDLNGRKLIERQIPVGGDSFEIDVSSWQSGVYFCRLTINDQIITKKIIKQ